MNDIKVFVKADPSKELPKEGEIVTCYSFEYSHSHTYSVPMFVDHTGQWQEEGDILEHHGYIESKIDYWLKEVSLTELMVGFAEWCNLLDNGTIRYNSDTKEESESLGFSPFDSLIGGNYKELVNRFFTEKGVVL